jgi:hypothetical protein
MKIENVYLASLNAAIDRGIADADAGRVTDSEQVRRMLLEQVNAVGCIWTLPCIKPTLANA